MESEWKKNRRNHECFFCSPSLTLTPHSLFVSFRVTLLASSLLSSWKKSLKRSVRKMVVATGAATATKFLSKPLSIHFHPPLLRFLSVWGRLRASSLNISLRITSAGFVRIAPHNPAARDFWADWRACSER